MSAIAGIIRARSAIVNQRELVNMAERLRIHGPDASGTWHSDACGLASNLRKVTPEDAYERQPLSRGPLTLAGDLRLNNRKDLITKLGLKPSQNALLPDSELVLSAYQKWGCNCVEHLMGAFVFAVWDESEQSLFLARDQTGEKTVFYHQSPDFFAFSSMPKGLLALPWIRRELNEEKLAEFLILNHANHQTSFYKNIHRLPPGHCLTFRNGSLTLRKYWELDLEQRIVLDSDNAYLEQGREILETCIRDALRSASPVGAMMSGGLDSSTVACIAARHLEKNGQRLQTFTEVPHLGPVPETETRYGDETPYIKAIHALNPNITPHFVPGLQKGIFEGADERLAILEAPHRNPFNQIWMEQICEDAAAQGIKVLLTGQSGNMSLSYDGLWQLPSLFKSLRWLRLAREVNAVAKSSGTSRKSLLKSKMLQPLVPDSLWSRYKRRSQTQRSAWETFSAINPNFAREIDIGSINRQAGHDSSFRVPSDSRLARAIGLTGLDYRGESYAYFATANEVELRDPLGDIRFTQWCLSIPESQYLQGGECKWFAKRLAQELLPASVGKNPKKGIQASDWTYYVEQELPSFKGELHAAKQSDLCQRILDLEQLAELLETWPGIHKASSNKYRYKLARGLVTARFLRRSENLLT